jgi:septum formation inhibitor-activating ATPase MinD
MGRGSFPPEKSDVRFNVVDVVSRGAVKEQTSIADKALDDLVILQKALMTDSSEDIRDTPNTNLLASELLRMEDSLFSSRFDFLAGDHIYGK